MSENSNIKPFHVMDILERCKQMEAQGQDVVHMEIGEPDFPSPEPIVRAGITALQNNQTHYTGALGLWELRQRISERIAEERHNAVAEPLKNITFIASDCRGTSIFIDANNVLQNFRIDP